MATAVTSKSIDLSLEADHFTSFKGLTLTPIPLPPVVTLTATTFQSLSVSVDAVAGLIRRTPYLNGVAQVPIVPAVAPAKNLYTYPGLTQATPYTLTFTDTNVSGEGSTSVPIVVSTDNPPVFIPTAPVIALVTQDSNSATLSLTSGATTATSFTPTVNGAVRVDLAFTAFPRTITGLSAGTPFTIAVTPSNSAGAGPISNTVSGTTDVSPTGSQFLLKSFIVGTPDWTNPDDEITRLAYCDTICFQLHPGVTAANYSDRISAIKAKQTALGLPQTTKYLAYINVSEIQATSASGVWGPFFTLISSNNWYARAGNGTTGASMTGAIQIIQNPGGAVNIASPRTGNASPYTGLTAGEAMVDLYFSLMADKLSQMDGVMFDNFNFALLTYDANEDGVSESSSAVASRNAQITALTKCVNRVKFRKPGALIYNNPQVTQKYLKSGLDDRAAFAAMNLDGFMNQNAGPGVWYMDYGAFPFTGSPSSPWGSVRGPYPGTNTQPGTTPTSRSLYRINFVGFARSPAIPTGGNALHWGDTAYECQTYPYVSNRQNILQEVHGYQDENNPAWPWAKQWNRLCLGLWYVMTDVIPFLYGVDSTPTMAGVSVLLPEQIWFRHQVAIDSPGWLRAPYFTANGIPAWYRRWPNGCLILWPRAEETAFSTANFPSLPTSAVLPTPPLPAGKSVYKTFAGATVGSTITVPYDSCTWLQAF